MKAKTGMELVADWCFRNVAIRFAFHIYKEGVLTKEEFQKEWKNRRRIYLK